MDSETIGDGGAESESEAAMCLRGSVYGISSTGELLKLPSKCNDDSKRMRLW